MLVQKPYHEPYIPNGPAGLPYVGAELESITSETPFWRGQGIPIYPFEEKLYNQNRYYAGPLDRFKKAQELVAKAQAQAQAPIIKRVMPSMVRPGKVTPDAFVPPVEEESTGLSLGMKIGLGAVALVVVGVSVAKILD
jgi:hypothetical protein